MSPIHGVKFGSRISGRGRVLSWVTWGHESWQALFLLRAYPRPAPPARFRPSLPGGVDPGDEFVGPSNRLVNILEHGQALC